MRIEILDKAAEDLRLGWSFYESQQAGLGSYFVENLISDLDSLRLSAGIHRLAGRYHRLISNQKVTGSTLDGFVIQNQRLASSNRDAVLGHCTLVLYPIDFSEPPKRAYRSAREKRRYSGHMGFTRLGAAGSLEPLHRGVNRWRDDSGTLPGKERACPMILFVDTAYTMYNMPPMDVCFVELQAFTEEVLRVADEETLRQFEAELAANPESGDLIRNSGGLRKARMKLPGRGKSAGARAVYLWLPETRRIVLFMLYTKAKRADIPQVLLARLRVAVETIKAKYNR